MYNSVPDTETVRQSRGFWKDIQKNLFETEYIPSPLSKQQKIDAAKVLTPIVYPIEKGNEFVAKIAEEPELVQAKKQMEKALFDNDMKTYNELQSIFGSRIETMEQNQAKNQVLFNTLLFLIPSGKNTVLKFIEQQKAKPAEGWIRGLKPGDYDKIANIYDRLRPEQVKELLQQSVGPEGKANPLYEKFTNLTMKDRVDLMRSLKKGELPIWFEALAETKSPRGSFNIKWKGEPAPSPKRPVSATEPPPQYTGLQVLRVKV